MVITHLLHPFHSHGLGRHETKPNAPTLRTRPATSPTWRYQAPHTGWLTYLLAIILSASFHVAIFYGVGRHHAAPKIVAEEKANLIRIVMPDLKELEDPEPIITDNSQQIDMELYRPTLMDAPSRIAVASDFVQSINYASLVPAPDLNAAKVFVIPERNPDAGKLAGLGNIFNLADLDRVPVPILQPAPIFPVGLRRSAEQADVLVEFIVDREGRVVNPFVVESTHPGFNEAATSGVARWRFRPGIKAGQKVNTRMTVPIIFRVTGQDM